MREIKFRGKRMSDGETIYGYYHVRSGDAYIEEWRVEPKTVAQLAGYDTNGDEVYEGDEAVDCTTGETVKVMIGFRNEGAGGLTSVPLGGRLFFYELKK